MNNMSPEKWTLEDARRLKAVLDKAAGIIRSAPNCFIEAVEEQKSLLKFFRLLNKVHSDLDFFDARKK